MSHETKLMVSDRNLLLRAMRILFYNGRRHSFLEKTDFIDEHEEKLYAGRGEELYNDLISFKHNRHLTPEQEKELDAVAAELLERVKEINKDLERELEEDLLIEGNRKR